jgi:hypothetical protein
MLNGKKYRTIHHEMERREWKWKARKRYSSAE